MPMPDNVGELRELLDGIDDDVPVRGQLQGLPNWDWSLYLSPAGEGPDEQADQDVFVISMDM